MVQSGQSNSLEPSGGPSGGEFSCWFSAGNEFPLGESTGSFPTPGGSFPTQHQQVFVSELLYFSPLKKRLILHSQPKGDVQETKLILGTWSGCSTVIIHPNAR